MEQIRAEDFDKAFAEYQVFGPRRAIPIEERWREVLPHLDPGNFPGIKQRCKEIEQYAFRLAEQVHASSLSVRAGESELRREFPDLTAERASRTWNQAMYFAMK